MRIAARLKLSTWLTVIVSLAILTVMFVSLQAVESAVRQNTAVAEALNDIFQLSILTTDYIVNFEPRAESQWTTKHATLGDELEALELQDPEDVMLLERVRASHGELAPLFRDIGMAHASVDAGTVDPEVSREYQVRLAARLLIVMQSMVSDSVALSSSSSARAVVAQRVAFTAIAAIAFVGTVLILGNAVLSERAIVGPLRTLRGVASEVGRGNLGTRSGIRSPDEVGDLAVAFDGMIADLRTSYAMLEKEIADRRRAEDELGEYRDHLELLVQDRTEELVALNEELQRATLTKDEFLAAMSHELRTPLNSIIGFTDLILKGMTGPVNEEQERQLSMVHRSGQQLLGLVNDVLDLSRLDAGHLDLTADDVDVARAVGLLVEMVAPMAAERNLVLDWSITDAAPRRIRTDASKFDQIMLNVLSNGIKFTDTGGITVKVDGGELGELVVEVADTGVGIPEGLEEAIFERFNQGGPARSVRYGGTGLGLAISRTLAEVLGGTLVARANPQGGATFVLTLPA